MKGANILDGAVEKLEKMLIKCEYLGFRTYRPELRHCGIMADILKHFEESATKFTTPREGQNKGVGTDYDDVPIFNRQRANFYPEDPIVQFCICKETIVIAMTNDILLRLNLRQPDMKEEIDLSMYTNQLKISRIFLSPNGEHTLLSTLPERPHEQAELLYLPKNSTKIRAIQKFRGLLATAVAWTAAGPFLVGTSKGLLVEIDVSPEAGLFASNYVEYCKQLFEIKPEAPITGLQVFNHKDRFHVLVTTPMRIYHHHGKVISTDSRPLLSNFFTTILSKPEKCESIQQKQAVKQTSKLDLILSVEPDSPPMFGWLTTLGLYYGQVPEGDDSLLKNSELISYPEKNLPQDLVLTHHHALLLFPTYVTGINLLTHEVVFQDFFEETPDDNLRQIVREPIKGSLYVVTEKTVWRYRVLKEDRHVWRYLVELGEFDKARDYCKGDPILLDQVTTRQAEALFEKEDYELCAYYYSQSCSVSFEEVALKFLRSQQVPPLISFLRRRLDIEKEKDSMQRTMLVVWLVELYLSRLGHLETHSAEQRSVQAEFDELLATPAVRDCVAQNKGTIYDLMAAHGDMANFIKLSIAHRDYERVIRQHVYKEEYMEALGVLQRVTSSKKDLIYQFAPSLIRHIPTQLVQFLQSASGLNPAKLLPALALTYEDASSAKDAARYLQFCVDTLKRREQSLHNLLLALYVRHQPDKLRIYLAAQGQDPSTVNYDIHFALRLCQENGLQEACVQLSALLGLWSSAVELALAVNVPLAEQTVKMQQQDPDLTKSLWLKIAEHVVKEKNDIKSAMEFLKVCPLLKIEDILPFFPDFVTIDDFKDLICNSLQEYNQHIQDLKDEMDESTKSAELIIQEMSAFKNRHVDITWSDNCTGCRLQLLLRAFYCFPCGHHFHTDCLQDAVLPYLTPATVQRLRDLQRQLASVGADDTSSASGGITARSLILGKIDSVLAAECYLCGDVMVENIDQPFVSDLDWERVAKEWEL